MRGRPAKIAAVKSDIARSGRSRGPYNYSTELGQENFRIIATYNGPPGTGAPAQMTIDQNLEIH